MIKCQIFIFLYLLIYSSIIIIRKNDDKMKKSCCYPKIRKQSQWQSQLQ